MRFADVFRIALHNLRYNKSRTLLTVIIVTVVSTLIMALCLIGTSFYSNQMAVNRLVFDLSGTEYYLRPDYSGSGRYAISDEEVEQTLSIAKKYNQVIDRASIKIETSRAGEYFNAAFVPGEAPQADASMEIWQWISNAGGISVGSGFDLAVFGMYEYSVPDLIREGRVWTAADAEGDGLWLSTDTVEDFAELGAEPGIGDKITLVLYGGGRNDDYRTHTFTLEGVYYSEAVSEEESWGSTQGPAYIMSSETVMDAFDGMCEANTVTMSYRPPKTEYNYSSVYNAMKSFNEDVNAVIPPMYYSGGMKVERFTCTYVETMEMTALMSAFILGVVVLLAFLILLLSVGSVANTIIISVDKDRKFIGLLKAMGLNQKGVRRIVTCQSMCMIVLGVAIGVGALFLLQPVALSLMESLFASMFSFMSIEYTVTAAIPVYLPVVTALMFFLLATAFSRGSLSKIAKQDVISTISEVA